MAKKKATTNGIVLRDGQYYILCGNKEHKIRVEGRIKTTSVRTPVVAPPVRTAQT